MAIVANRRDPFAQDFRSLQDEINRLFDFDYLPESRGIFDRAAATSPPIDVIENADAFIVLCELPGIEMDDLDLTVAGESLTIKGSKNRIDIPEGAKVYKREAWSGDFQRTLSLPSSVDVDGVEAIVNNGLLRIVLPKREELKPRKVKLVSSR